MILCTKQQARRYPRACCSSMESVLLFGLKRGKETVIPPLTVGRPHRQAAAAGHQAGSMARALMELVLLPDLKRGGEAVILP